MFKYSSPSKMLSATSDLVLVLFVSSISLAHESSVPIVSVSIVSVSTSKLKYITLFTVLPFVLYLN